MTFLQDIQKHASRPENGTEMKNEVASVGEGGGNDVKAQGQFQILESLSDTTWQCGIPGPALSRGLPH